MLKKLFAVFLGVSFLLSGSSALAYNASYVIGQSLFTSSSTGTTSATLNTPKDVEYDSDDELLYVMDYSNNRVLVFDASVITNGEAAIHVLGQNDFTTSASDTAVDRLAGPVGLALDSEGDKLFVMQESDRVSIFDVSTIDDGEDAVNFLGFWGGGGPTSTSADSTARAFDSSAGTIPMGMFYDEDTEYLYVADAGNHRVLVFDMNVITDGEDAIHVLGQSGYGVGNVAAGTMPTGFSSPSYISLIDSLGYLAVSNGSCVALFDVNTITDGEAAVRVIGYNELACDGSGGATTNQNGFIIGIPYGNANDNTKDILYVADPFQGIKLFDSSSITTGENAFSVISQTSFANTDMGTTQELLNFPSNVVVDEVNDRLFVVDENAHRIMVYEFVNMTDSSVLNSGTVGVAYSKTLATENDQGTVGFAVISGALPTGLSLAADGTISGTPTTEGDYSFSVRATDVVVDDVQEFFDDASFSISIAAAPSSGGGGGGGSSGSRIRGCMDPIATNYDDRARVDNGSCRYPEPPQSTQTSISCPVFTGYAKMWSKDNDKNEVMKIQQFLNDKMGETLKVDGTFGLGTYFAVKRFQEKYYNEVIVPWQPVNGLSHTTGWWHKTTSAWANQLSGCPVTVSF